MRSIRKQMLATGKQRRWSDGALYLLDLNFLP